MASEIDVYGIPSFITGATGAASYVAVACWTDKHLLINNLPNDLQQSGFICVHIGPPLDWILHRASVGGQNNGYLDGWSYNSLQHLYYGLTLFAMTSYYHHPFSLQFSWLIGAVR